MIQKATQYAGKALKLGGAIRSDVRQLDLYTPALDYKKILRENALLQGPPRPKTFLHGVIDFIPRNLIGYHTVGPRYTSEAELHGSLMSSVSGHGAKRDHPTVIRAVHESLKNNPELLDAYMHA